MEIELREPYNVLVKKLLAFISLAFLHMWLAAPVVSAAELLVIEQDYCPYCAKFNREIAQAYPKTEEGARAPLRRLDLHDDWPDQYRAIQKAEVTPTFILVENGQEIDRLVGYPGDEYFWFLINGMLDKLQ